jgi:multicomponent Na+:H+ antiporter subunit B
MKKNLILEIITKLLLPFIIGFAIYLQLNGEDSPGGGFQAGMILAAGFILYGLIAGNAKLHTFVSEKMIDFCIVIGGLIYGSTGVLCMLNGGEFLNYYFLKFSSHHSQQLGIMIVEIGVGLTVFAVTLKTFYYFAEGEGNDSSIE